MSEDGLALWRRTEIGIVFQFFNLVPGLTLAQNVRLPMDLAGTSPPPSARRACGAARRVGLADRPAGCPRGSAAATSSGPPSPVPTPTTRRLSSATSPPVARTPAPRGLFDLFRHWVAGKTFLMVTHSRELAARTGRTIELADGRIIRDHHH